MRLHLLLPVCAVALLAACAAPVQRADWSGLAPLTIDGEALGPEAAIQGIHVDDLLELDQEMEEFLDRYVRTARAQRTRLRLLHLALGGRGVHGLRYDPGANGSARKAFHSGHANCLSYANLFIAMARAVGLRAEYQVVDTKPEWNKRGQRLAVAIHVNAVVDLKNQERFEVDIDPLSRARIMGTRRVDDGEALALHYNNVGMELFLDGNTQDAYRHLVYALKVEPRLELLWANIGAIYRSTGQSEAAESAYRTALYYDSNSRTAMNNLAILYQTLGQTERADKILNQIKLHRERNPYYHVQLAEAAEFDGDYGAAIRHLHKAIHRKDSDAEFYYLLGRVLHKADRVAESIENLRMAVDKAQLITQREQIQNYLDAVLGETAM